MSIFGQVPQEVKSTDSFALLCPHRPLLSVNNMIEARSIIKEGLTLHFAQHWLVQREANFQEAVVYLAYDGPNLFIYADIRDRNIRSVLEEKEKPHFMQVDTFEMFVGSAEHTAYLEYHYSLTEEATTLLWPNKAILRYLPNGVPDLSPFIVEDNKHLSQVMVGENGWEVLVRLPLSSIPGISESDDPARLSVSFGRYDYRDDSKDPVISSTSSHQELSFHRRDEWTIIEFCDSSQ